MSKKEGGEGFLNILKLGYSLFRFLFLYSYNAPFVEDKTAAEEFLNIL
ncbi:MAG: hypothetical protein WDM90_19070 [Ferruginibacter sp.]